MLPEPTKARSAWNTRESSSSMRRCRRSPIRHLNRRAFHSASAVSRPARETKQAPHTVLPLPPQGASRKRSSYFNVSNDKITSALAIRPERIANCRHLRELPFASSEEGWMEVPYAAESSYHSGCDVRPGVPEDHPVSVQL
jgi:hypothetical protein